MELKFNLTSSKVEPKISRILIKVDFKRLIRNALRDEKKSIQKLSRNISHILIKAYWSGHRWSKSFAKYFQSLAPIVQIDQREWYQEVRVLKIESSLCLTGLISTYPWYLFFTHFGHKFAEFCFLFNKTARKNGWQITPMLHAKPSWHKWRWTVTREKVVMIPVGELIKGTGADLVMMDDQTYDATVKTVNKIRFMGILWFCCVIHILRGKASHDTR